MLQNGMNDHFVKALILYDGMVTEKYTTLE